MIRMIPFDERDDNNKREILRAYLKLLAKGTKFSNEILRALFTQKFGFSEKEAMDIIDSVRSKRKRQ